MKYTFEDFTGVFGKHELESVAAKVANTGLLSYKEREFTEDERYELRHHGWATLVDGRLILSLGFLSRIKHHLDTIGRK
jgi:hypothetical protein